MAELDLDGVADLVLAAAQGDEQVEAYVERSRDTEVRVYEGEARRLRRRLGVECLGRTREQGRRRNRSEK